MQDQPAVGNRHMKRTQLRHIERIQRVIDHIHNHCHDDIDSATVADIAHLSTFHWHRIYVAVTGESAVATLRRVRLERSATALLRDDRPVAAIAAECGFENLQAFTRLFRRAYGLPPGRFRTQAGRLEQQADSRLENAAPTPDSRNDVSASLSPASGKPVTDSHGRSASDMRDSPASSLTSQSRQAAVTIEQREPLRLVGLWHQGDYHLIGRVFERVMAAAGLGAWPRSHAFTVGVYFDDPDVVPLADCRSFAGVPVSDDFEPPEGYDLQSVPGGLHACCLHTGPYALLPESYSRLYRQWLRESEHDARDSPCHEIYLNTPHDTASTALETLVCMPLIQDRP